MAQNIHRLHVDEIKLYTERIIAEVGNLLIPTFSQRVEDFFMKRMSQPHGMHLPETTLGESLIKYGNLKASNEIVSPFLNCCGEAHIGIGTARKKFIEESNAYLVTPLKAFLDVDIKSTLSERRKLSMMRLDLDVAKTQYRKCTKTDKLKILEDVMNTHNDKYSRQYQITLDAYNKIIQSHNQHSEYFSRYIASYKKYLSESMNLLETVSLNGKAPPNKDLAYLNISDPPPQTDNALVTPLKFERNREERKAKVTCDFNASDPEEISVLQNELVVVNGIDAETKEGYVLINKINGDSGRIPNSYIEYM